MFFFVFVNFGFRLSTKMRVYILYMAVLYCVTMVYVYFV